MESVKINSLNGCDWLPKSSKDSKMKRRVKILIFWASVRKFLNNFGSTYCENLRTHSWISSMKTFEAFHPRLQQTIGEEQWSEDDNGASIELSAVEKLPPMKSWLHINHNVKGVVKEVSRAELQIRVWWLKNLILYFRHWITCLSCKTTRRRQKW